MKWLLVVCIALMCNASRALDNGLALTPPMGFLSWEKFRCNIDCSTDPNECISEDLFKTIADAMVSGGYLAAGYEYVNIDDCWLAGSRDENGNLQPDPQRFPSGIKPLADYIHGLGLKFGIYEDYGNFTCAGYPGVLGHLQQDAQTFAAWGVDYLKLDGCYSDINDMPTGYPQMGKYLNETGRPIVYSCSWPAYYTGEGLEPDYTAIENTCNLWRNWDDIEDTWESVLSIIDYFGDNQDDLIQHAGPGHWNDPDMIIVGDEGLSLEQSKVQLAIWSILAAPLLISADLRTIDPTFAALLLNEDVIAVDQDSMGMQGRRLSKAGGLEVWRRYVMPMVADGTHSAALAFLDRGSEQTTASFRLTDLGLNFPDGYMIADIYTGEDYGMLYPSSTLKININSNGVVFLKAALMM